jgi:hypothetical protein
MDRHIYDVPFSSSVTLVFFYLLRRHSDRAEVAVPQKE